MASKAITSSVSIPLLIIAALATDLLTPLAIWKGVLPEQVRWISHGAIAAMIPAVYIRMMLIYGVPRAVCFAVLASAIGVTVALANGQSLLATAWGWWVMFQFPLVGLYAYLWRHWPARLPEWLYRLCFVALGVQVLVQIGQYALGQTPGDDLAGLFGWHGTGSLAVFIVLVYCLALGRWLARKAWWGVVLVLVLGSIASALGEMKLFPFSVLVLSLLAAAILSVQKGSLHKLIPFALVSAGMLVVSVAAYDRIVSAGGYAPSLTAYLQKDSFNQYMSGTNRHRGVYYMGRNYALAYGWKAIRRDSFTLLLGFGLGARGESRSLGTAGTALRGERLSFETGTSLLVAMQETGMLGLLAMAACVIWIVQALIKGLMQDPQSEAAALRFGLILFSLLWPLLFWYNHVLTLRVPMVLYWAILGYVLGESCRSRSDASGTVPDAVSVPEVTTHEFG
jgi:hypothetical protein